MCGIAGIVDFEQGRTIEKARLRSMVEIIKHRGPDKLTTKVFGQVGFAHARLSIIDLQTGDQPMHNEDQTVWTIFNGEIFNYVELREELTRKGHHFYTHSDTEVIVHLYEDYGIDFVDHLNGQFAIALYDIKNNKVILARDRVGILPLFYYQDQSRFYFASEIKSILAAVGEPPTVNREALDQLFTFWSPVSPSTVFENVYEVSPGQTITIENAKLYKKRYWDWEFPVDNQYRAGNSDILSEELKELLIDATRIRLRSDVPVGAYLSGGLDSSTIVALIDRYTSNPLRTFSIGFDEGDFDETEHQSSLVRHLRTKHSYIKCSNRDIAEEFLDAIWHIEAPILRTAPVPMKMLSKLVRDGSYKVTLTGEGADEVLGGYDIFKEAKIRRFWSRYPASEMRPALLKKLYPYLDLSRGSSYLKAFFGQGLDAPDDFTFTHLTRWSSTSKCKDFFSDQTKSAIKNDAISTLSATRPESFQQWHYFNRAQYIEAKSLMGGYLLCSQGDRMLMTNSVEGRFPFLDHRVIELANSIHPRFKMKALNEKYLLKKAMSSDLPDSITRRYKQPYRAPNISAFYSTEKPEYVGYLLSNEKVSEYGYFQPEKVERLIRKIEAGRAIGNKDNMALVGILSTQALHFEFIENFNRNFTRRD